MPYNPKIHAQAGYISKRHKERLDEIVVYSKRNQKSTLEHLIDQEYDRMLKEAQA